MLTPLPTRRTASEETSRRYSEAQEAAFAAFREHVSFQNDSLAVRSIRSADTLSSDILISLISQSGTVVGQYRAALQDTATVAELQVWALTIPAMQVFRASLSHPVADLPWDEVTSKSVCVAAVVRIDSLYAPLPGALIRPVPQTDAVEQR